MRTPHLARVARSTLHAARGVARAAHVPRRSVACVALLLGTLALPQGQQSAKVYTAEVDGIIHPVAAEYVREVIARADAAGAAL